MNPDRGRDVVQTGERSRKAQEDNYAADQESNQPRLEPDSRFRKEVLQNNGQEKKRGKKKKDYYVGHYISKGLQKGITNRDIRN